MLFYEVSSKESELARSLAIQEESMDLVLIGKQGTLQGSHLT